MMTTEALAGASNAKCVMIVKWWLLEPQGAGRDVLKGAYLQLAGGYVLEL